MPYDALGNYVPGDDSELDQMKYELSLLDTVKQMVKSPANDLSALTKPQTYKDILGGFGSAAESLVRGAGAAPFGAPGDIIKHFQDTPFIPGVTDRISMNDVFPGLNTVQEAVAPEPFALPQRRVPNMSVAPERPKQELFGLPYATTGDILETATSRYTAPFGDKEANDFMEGLGMFLSPQMAAGARKGIINMIETTGKMPSLTVDSAQAFARDYANAMNGVYPEAPTVGSMAADFARQGKAAGRKAGQVIGETIEDVAQRRAAGEGAYANPFSPQSMMADVMAGPRSYAVRPVNAGQLLKETDLPNFKYAEANPKIHTVGYRMDEDILPYTGTEYLNTTRAEYYRHAFERDMDVHRLYDDWSSKRYMEMFPDAPSLDAARRAYSNQGNLIDRSKDQMQMMSEFANSPELNQMLDQKASARDLAIDEYNKVKNTPKSELKTEEAKDLHKARIDELELDLLKKDYAPELSSEEFRKRISVPTAEEYLRRANAARKYIMGEFRNDIAKYVGTSQGPQMELAKRGVTVAPREELVQRAKTITQGGGDYRELQKKRQAAGFNPLGEMQPLIVQKEAELAEQQNQLNELNAKQNALREQHRLEMPDEPDPARNPTQLGAEYRALRNPMTSLIEKMQKNKKQLENFQLANAYEMVSDIGFLQKPASEWRQTIPYEQRHFFPMLFNQREEPVPFAGFIKTGEYLTPDDAPIFQVASGATKNLGIDFLAEQYTQAMIDGRVPIDEKGKPTVSVEKFIEQITKPRLKEEELKELESSKSQIRLNDYAQRSISSVPTDMRFQNASALELTKDNPIDVIRRQVSFDGMVLDNCVAATDAPHPGINPFTNERYNYSYPVDPATGANRGDRARKSSYMEQIHEGRQRYASLRDNATGMPVVNINMLRTADSGSANPKFNVQYVSGYQNNQIDKKYTNDVRDYLNARADIIQGSGTGIDKWGIFDLTAPGGQSAAASALGVPKSSLGAFDLPRFVTEKDLRELARQQPVGESHADLVAARDRLSQEMRQLINEYGAGAPEAQDVADQLRDIESRLNAISTQVRTAPDNMATPSLFRRMTTEALTNAARDEGNIGNVRAVVDNLLDADSYGLRELWSDDYDFYPVALRNFVNGVRTNADLPVALTNREDGSAFAIQARERLARFAMNIRDFTPMERELFVRELDNYAETNINQMAENLYPDNPTQGLEEIEDSHPGTIQYLRDIETRRRGNDVPTQTAPALQAPTQVPRDIAEQITPTNYLNRDETVQQLAERLNNSVRNLPEDRETLQEALAQYQRNPLDIPGAIEMVLPPEGANDSRRLISNYLMQQIQSRINSLTPEGGVRAAPALPPVTDPRIVSLANDIVPANQAFRNQTTEDISNAIREQLLPSIGIFNPNAPTDRANLERMMQHYQNSPLDVDLGQRLETFIQDRPNNENQIRERIADFMIDQIQRRLGHQLEPQAVPARSTATMNAVTDLTLELYNESERNGFDIPDLTSTLHALDSGNFDHPRIRELPEGERAGAQTDIASTMRLVLGNHGIDIPPDIFAGGIEAAPQLPAPAGNGPEAYRDRFTNEEMGSRRAFDQIMQAERMTPGAINEAIRRTDGNARYDQDVMQFYNVQAPAGISQINNALRQYMEGNGFDHPPRPVENAIDELERRYPDREFVYDPDDLANEIDYEMERQERILTRQQYGRLEDLVDEIQRDAGENFEDLIDTIDRIRMRQGIDGDVDIALGDMRARLIRGEERERLEFDREQRARNREPEDDMANVEPEHALVGALDAAEHNYQPDLVQEMRDLVGNLYNDDIRFDREPEQFIARLRDEAREYEGQNETYSNAVDEMASFLEQYMRERIQRTQRFKKGGVVHKETGGRVEPTSPSSSVNDQSKPVQPVKKIHNPDAPEFKDLFIRERANRGGGGGGGGSSPADIKQMMNPRNITYNAGGKVSVDEMRYELLRKQ